jgi:hypothetical protein
MDRGDRNKKP